MISTFVAKLLKSAGLLVLVFALSSSNNAQKKLPRKPNIIFIFADDLGWGDLGCYGNREIKTPRIDRLAKEGTLFTHFYVNSPVCSPSRAAVLTGQYPARVGIHGHIWNQENNQRRSMPDWLDTTVCTVPRLLKQQGYATAHFGKWHLGGGYDVAAPDPGAYFFDKHKTVNSAGPGFENQHDPYFFSRSSRLIVDETLNFIRENKDKPFYVNVWMLLPHSVLNPTDAQMEPYKRFSPSDKIPHKGAKQIYYASVTDMDHEIGRLLDKLADMGLEENTLVVFSSDNGPEEIMINNASHSAAGDPGPFRGRKRSLYEGGIRVPFIVKWPGHTPAGVVDDQSIVSSVDLLPTFCQVAGAPLLKNMHLDGEDISAVLAGKTRKRQNPLMWEWRFDVIGPVINKSPVLAVRQDEWKLLMNPDGSRVELYNIVNDPTELNNLAHRETKIVTKLKAKLLAWQKTLPEGKLAPDAGRNNYYWPGRK